MEQQAIDDGILGHVLDLSRFDAGLRRDSIAILEKLQKELIAELANKKLTGIGKADKNRLLKQATEAIDSAYKNVAGVVDVGGIAQHTVDATVSAIDKSYGGALSVSIPTQAKMKSIASNVLIEGAVLNKWWKKQSEDTAFKFTGAVRQGLVAAETNQQIIKRVQGVMAVSKRNAAALVQTSVANIAHDARNKTFEANRDITKGEKFVATLDQKTSLICASYSGSEWDNNHEPINGTTLPYRRPILHWNCRSVLVPLLKTFRELGMDIDEMPIGTRASVDGQVSASTTFDDFLQRKGDSWQDDVLGKGRAQLYRDKTITLNQLVNNNGRVLTLAELNAKYKK